MEIVVYSPEIAGNVGAIIRLSANSGVPVNFIKPFGFNMQENKIRRAGLDYHDLASAKTYETWEEFIRINKGAELCSLTSKSTEPYWNASLNMYDFLIFGPEFGIPDMSSWLYTYSCSCRIRICSQNLSIPLPWLEI